MKKSLTPIALLAAALLAASGTALADITVGVTVSATGPAASLGIPEKNTIALMPPHHCRAEGQLHRTGRCL